MIDQRASTNYHRDICGLVTGVVQLPPAEVASCVTAGNQYSRAVCRPKKGRPTHTHSPEGEKIPHFL